MIKNRDIISINENPIDLFNKWFEEAKSNEINDPNAMNLATVDSEMKPTSRMVLLKSFDLNEFIFYTNLNSKKGQAIIKNSNVALNFYWKSIRKQVRVEGVAKIISGEVADKYFNSRPDGSKIGAWASKQSYVLTNREELENSVNDFKKKFEGKKIKRPEYWTGFSVKPLLIEFWQEMEFRLHDRTEFNFKDNIWVARKLYP